MKYITVIALAFACLAGNLKAMDQEEPQNPLMPDPAGFKRKASQITSRPPSMKRKGLAMNNLDALDAPLAVYKRTIAEVLSTRLNRDELSIVIEYIPDNYILSSEPQYQPQPRHLLKPRALSYCYQL